MSFKFIYLNSTFPKEFSNHLMPKEQNLVKFDYFAISSVKIPFSSSTYEVHLEQNVLSNNTSQLVP